MKLWLVLPLIVFGAFVPGTIVLSNNRNPCNKPVLCALGAVDQSYDRPIGAILAEIDLIIVQYPQATEGYRLRAFFRKRNEDYRGALADVEQVIRLDPSSTDLYRDRLWLREQTEADPQVILRDHDQLVTAYPDVEVIAQRGSFKAAVLKDYKGAVQDYDRAIAMADGRPGYCSNDPNVPISLHNMYASMHATRAKLKHYHLQDVKGALPDYDRAIKCDPQPSAYSYYDRGQLKAKHLNDRKGAIADLQLFLKLLKQENAPKAWGPDVESAKQVLEQLQATPSPDAKPER